MFRIEVCCTPLAFPIYVRYPAGTGSWVPLAWPALTAYDPSVGAWQVMTDRLQACLGSDYGVISTDTAVAIARIDAERFDLSFVDLDLRAYFGFSPSHTSLDALVVLSDQPAEGVFAATLGGDYKRSVRALSRSETDHLGRVRVKGYGVDRLFTVEYVVTTEYAQAFARIVDRLQAGETATLYNLNDTFPVNLLDPGADIDLTNWVNEPYTTIKKVTLTFALGGRYL
jgi:hypothetical protein